MPLSVNATETQVKGEPSKIYFTDLTTGTDVTIVKRRIYLTDKDGNPVVESGTTTTYEEWNDFPATDEITLDLLTRDMALSGRIDWLNNSNVAVYTLPILLQFPLYAKEYYWKLIKAQRLNDGLRKSGNFYHNFIALECSIKQAEDAITVLEDINSSQAALDRAHELINNSSYFF